MKYLLICMILASIGGFIFSEGQAASDSSSEDADIEQNSDYRAAVAAIKTEDYENALVFLKKADQSLPENADILNLLGYSYRQLGVFESSLDYYHRALEIDPQHLGANEYLGELYLQTGELEKAQERLEVLADACWFGCEEYDELKEAIEAYKKEKGLK